MHENNIYSQHRSKTSFVIGLSITEVAKLFIGPNFDFETLILADRTRPLESVLTLCILPKGH